MKPFLIASLPLALALVFVGCKPQTPVVSTSNTPPADYGGAKPGGLDTPANPPSTSAAPAATTPAQPAVKPADIPANLKTDAYKYAGVENSAPMDLEITTDGQATLTGAATTTIKELKDGKLTLSIQRTGAIGEKLGNEEDSVETDGIHMISSSMGTVTPARSMELPAKLDPGTTWKVSNRITRPDSTWLEEDMTYTVVGPRKVDTKASHYDNALLVTTKGSFKTNDQAAPAAGKIWYVAGKGMVRMEVTQLLSKKGEKARTTVIQETK